MNNLNEENSDVFNKSVHFERVDMEIDNRSITSTAND